MPKKKQISSIEHIRNVPKLRFSEFEGEWERFEFGKIAQRRKERFNPKLSKKSFPSIELECLSQETGILLETFDSNQQKSTKNVFFKNDVLFGKLRPYLKKFYKTTFDGVCSSEIWVLKGNKVVNDYLYYLIQTEKFNYEVNQTSGSKMPRADWAYISEIFFKIPYIPEQQKIAQFLTAIDTRIQSLEKKKSLLEQYKKGVMQKIFKRELRFKDDNGKEFPAWEKKRLGAILIEVNEKSNESNQHTILSSTAKGLFNQSDYFNRDIASKDNTGYKILRKTQLVFSPQNLWLGNINVNNDFEIGIVSPSYKIFNFNENLTSHHFCQYLLFTNRMFYEYAQASEQGASVVRRNLDMNSFKAIPIKLPSLSEQTKIANFLSAIDKKIDSTHQQIEYTKTYKKGLLQQMFV